jgi:DNA invertase Pin-like site-specific DNA recombinase
VSFEHFHAFQRALRLHPLDSNEGGAGLALGVERVEGLLEAFLRRFTRIDDGGLSGASLDRPAIQALLDVVRSRKIDIIVVYKVDRLTRSLADFAKLVELFDAHEVSFVSVTQSFNTTSSMGLTLNVFLSFAQFEREVIGRGFYASAFCLWRSAC